MANLRIFTDGACSGNQRSKNFGGWGAILVYGAHQKELCGGQPDTTNNRMELTAVIEALRALKGEGHVIELFTDSAYVADCFRKRWYATWERNGWRTSAGKPVENQDLWQELLQLVRRHHVQFYRVQGHVDLAGASTNAGALYEKFKAWNGPVCTFADFAAVIEMNNRADALANQGIRQVRST